MTLFGSRQPSVRFDKVNKIEVSFPFHPFYEEILLNHLRGGSYPYGAHLSLGDSPDAAVQEGSRAWEKWLDWVGKTVSILSGVAVIVFVVLLWRGITSIASLQVGNLLTIFGFTLFGGLVSVGGVKMVSVTANLRRAQQQIREVTSGTGGCPYVPALDDTARRQYKVGSPFEIGSVDFCSGCRLIDFHGRTVCKVSPAYNG